ncbi:hypothetical protein Tco_0515256 [Tanacetum coccineum]
MYSGAPLTYLLSALNICKKSSIDSPTLCLMCLSNTPLSLLPLLTGLCLGDSDLSCLILEKTLVRSGLLDMLRERPDLRPLRCSSLMFGVLDSECCDTSWIFEFLPEHHSKIRRAFTSFSFSCCTFSWWTFSAIIDNSSSTNETVNTAHSDPAASTKDQASTASYADDVMLSFFSNQSNAPQLDNKNLEQIDADDLEEMDLKWQVAMLTMRVMRFIKKTGRKLDLNDKEIVGFC